MKFATRTLAYRYAHLILFATLTVLTCSGCAVGVAALAGAGAAAYVVGDVKRTYPCPIDVAWDASLSALAAAEVPVVDAAKDQLKARIEAQTATGDKIKIVLASQGPVTTLSIRVNTFGNKQLSAAVLREIDRQLNDPGPNPRLAPQQAIGYAPVDTAPPPPRTAFSQLPVAHSGSYTR